MVWRLCAASLTALGLASCANFAVDQPSAITVDDASVVRRHLAGCWKAPEGAEKVGPIMLMLEMNPDRTVRSAKLQPAASSTPQHRRVAESAMAAVRDPTCGPLPLPADKYALWQTMPIELNASRP